MAYSEPETFRITKLTASSYTIELSQALSSNGSLIGWSNSHTTPIGSAMELNTPTTDAQTTYIFKLRIV